MGKHISLEEKAIIVIDRLCSCDLVQDLEWDVAMHPEKSPMINDKDAILINNLLGAIYTIAHGVNRDNSCYPHHTEWRDDLIKRYNKIKRDEYERNKKRCLEAQPKADKDGQGSSTAQNELPCEVKK